MSHRIWILILAVVASIVALQRFTGKHQGQQYQIGIIQTASHPALDAVRDGFIENIRNTLGHDVVISVRNGEGMLPQLETAAEQQVHDTNVDAIFAIGTPAAQAVVSNMTDTSHTKPIGVAAVSDVELLDAPSHIRMCGVQDSVNIELEINTLHQLLPDISTIGIMYTTSEPNSVHTMQEMQKYIAKKGIQAIPFGITHEGDIPVALETAFNQTDAIVLPTDNTLANAVSFIGEKAQAAKKPVVVSDPYLLQPGILMACGVDYHASGHDTATMLLPLLHDANAHAHVETTPENEIRINQKWAAELGITIPDHIMNIITHKE